VLPMLVNQSVTHVSELDPQRTQRRFDVQILFRQESETKNIEQFYLCTQILPVDLCAILCVLCGFYSYLNNHLDFLSL